MTGEDQQYFELCYQNGLIQSPFLEVGSARVQGIMPNLCDLACKRGLEKVIGVDIQKSDGVDVLADFSIEAAEFSQHWNWGTFHTVGVFNVLEHTYNPVQVLQNVLSITRPGGVIVVSTPVIWPIHNFPGDFVRLLPDWYLEFARQNQLMLKPETFCWLSSFGLKPISSEQNNNQVQIPNFLNSGQAKSPIRYWISRFAHRLFNTFGRTHVFPNVAIGAAFQIPGK